MNSIDDIRPITDLDALEALYGTPGAASLRKVANRLTPDYAAFVARARFCVLSTVGPDGTDASPRGDVDPVLTVLDGRTLALPDWRGNNRIDSLRNIVADGRASLMLMVPGATNVIRINGSALVTAQPGLLDRFAKDGAVPRSVIVIRIGEVYFQCARALVRAALWSGEDHSAGLPTPGQILANMTDGAVGGAPYDAEWPARAAKTMW